MKIDGKTLNDDNMHEALAELLDRQRISEVMLRFGRALDLHDWDMYAATLADEFEVNFFDLTGQQPATTTPAKFARFAAAALDRLTVVHRYTNFHIEIEGDEASGIFYHVSRHRLPNRHGGDQYIQYGWYENTFTRTPEGWKINRLTHKFQWCDGNPTLIDLTDPELQAATADVFGAQ